MDSKRSLCVYCVRTVMSSEVQPSNSVEPGRVVLSASPGKRSAEKTDICAVLSFAFGLLSFVIFAIVFAPVALILSIVSHFRLRDNDELKGHTLKNYGFATGLIGVLWAAFLLNGGWQLLENAMLGKSTTVATVPVSTPAPVQAVPAAQPTPSKAPTFPTGISQPAAPGLQSSASTAFQPAQPAPAANGIDEETKLAQTLLQLFEGSIEPEFQEALAAVRGLEQGTLSKEQAELQLSNFLTRLNAGKTSGEAFAEKEGVNLYLVSNATRHYAIAIQAYEDAGSNLKHYLLFGTQHWVTEAATSHAKARSEVEALKILAR